MKSICVTYFDKDRNCEMTCSFYCWDDVNAFIESFVGVYRFVLRVVRDSDIKR